ncbi:MAG: hypothetical protein ABL921_35985, partial [Pirellula sp.]
GVNGIAPAPSASRATSSLDVFVTFSTSALFSEPSGLTFVEATESVVSDLVATGSGLAELSQPVNTCTQANMRAKADGHSSRFNRVIVFPVIPVQ